MQNASSCVCVGGSVRECVYVCVCVCVFCVSRRGCARESVFVYVYVFLHVCNTPTHTDTPCILGRLRLEFVIMFVPVVSLA
jgi:hypothetical protein